jgi:two-component sensor histidine kinase
VSYANIDFSKDSETLLRESQFYVDKSHNSLEYIKHNAEFKKLDTAHINLGFSKESLLWLKLTFENKSEETLTKTLEIRNPLLQSVTLYDGEKKYYQGTLHSRYTFESLNPYFLLTLKAHESKVYYLKVKNSTTALRLGLCLKDEMNFIHDDHHQQLFIFVFLSILIMLFLYNVLLYLYTKESAYLFYCLYLFTLLFQQSTYLGITQIYMPKWFVYYDDLAVVFKVNIMYITAALFAKSFLLTQEYPRINKIYNIIIIAALIEMPLFGMQWFYFPEIAILTGFGFVLFNITASLYIYKQGYTQARLFVAGWSFLAVGFTLMILDALGVISVMQDFLNLILVLTAIEAMALSLAFTDRYLILKLQKEKSDTLLVETLKGRQKVIESEIEKQTQALHKAVENEKTLLRELHHRTKNNLQLILSLVRMQASGVNAEIKEYAKALESRINAIAKTHQMLYIKDELDAIDMREYIEEFCAELENIMEKNALVLCQVEKIFMPLREASYIGLIINELVTNSIKYATKEDLKIEVKLSRYEDGYRLEVQDSGDGFVQSADSKGIGIKLVKTLVQEQLEGRLSIENKSGAHFMIEFNL